MKKLLTNYACKEVFTVEDDNSILEDDHQDNVEQQSDQP